MFVVWKLVFLVGAKPGRTVIHVRC